MGFAGVISPPINIPDILGFQTLIMAGLAPTPPQASPTPQKEAFS